nr:hypothetical protein [candidate division Zixibacteria bacterium]
MKNNDLNLICFIMAILMVIQVKAATSRLTMPESKEFGPLIDTIIIENNNIFDTDLPRYDTWIYRWANKLHIYTRSYVVSREVLQKPGEPFSRELADETERNLRALRFISTASVEFGIDPSGRNIMRVVTTDVWTLTGGFSVHRNSGEVTYQLALKETNLLGTGQYIDMNYFFRDFDEDYAHLTFSERRLFGTRHYLELFYDESPAVGLKALFFGKPFYSLNSRFQYQLYLADINRRDDFYSGGKIIGQDDVSGSEITAHANYRFGNYSQKVTAGMEISYQDTRISNRRLYEENLNFAFPSDSVFWKIEPSAVIGNYHYVKTKRINEIDNIEDIALITSASVGYGWVIDAGSGHKLLNHINISNRYSAKPGCNYFFMTFDWDWWLDGPVDFRKRQHYSILYYNNRLPWLTIMMRGSYTRDWRQDDSRALYLGENNGVRGYNKNFQDGDRRFVFTLENRFFSGLEVFTTHLGVVQFFDMGQSWSSGDEFQVHNMLWSVGAGLRLGVAKFSGSKVVRVDFAYAGRTKSWQVSFGVGQYMM